MNPKIFLFINRTKSKKFFFLNSKMDLKFDDNIIVYVGLFFNHHV